MNKFHTNTVLAHPGLPVHVSCKMQVHAAISFPTACRGSAPPCACRGADFPSRLEAYVHRVGRTGRLAAAGHAFSFFTRALAPLAPPLLALLQVRGRLLL